MKKLYVLVLLGALPACASEPPPRTPAQIEIDRARDHLPTDAPAAEELAIEALCLFPESEVELRRVVFAVALSRQGKRAAALRVAALVPAQSKYIEWLAAEDLVNQAQPRGPTKIDEHPVPARRTSASSR